MNPRDRYTFGKIWQYTCNAFLTNRILFYMQILYNFKIWWARLKFVIHVSSFLINYYMRFVEHNQVDRFWLTTRRKLAPFFIMHLLLVVYSVVVQCKDLSTVLSDRQTWYFLVKIDVNAMNVSFITAILG